MPRGWIKQIEISVGTAITVSAGTVVTNTSIRSIQVRYNGKQIINITGQQYDDVPSMGILLLREINKHVHNVAETADFFALNFTDPLPPGDVQLIWSNASPQHIGADAAGTVTAGDHDIEVEIVDAGKASPVIPYISCGLFADENNTGDFYHYMQALPYRLRMLAFVTHDSGTKSATTYDKLTITNQKKGELLFEGKMTKLISEFQRKSGQAMEAGCFIKTFGKEGILVEPDSLLLKFVAGTAGTLKYIEWLAICY